MSKLDNIMTGAGTGASVGSMAGPYGMAIGGIAGGVIGGLSDPEGEQIDQQDRLNALNQRYNMGMLDYQMQKEYEMWLKTNYSAEVEQLKNAGLNPALLYKGGGGGITGNATGGNFQSQAGKDTERIGLGLDRMSKAMDLALLQSQKKNLDADTAVKLANAEKTKGVDTEFVKANIGQVTEATKNTSAAREGIELDNKLKELQIIVDSNTVTDKIEIVNQTMQQAQQLTDKLKQEVPKAGEIAQANLDNLRKDVEVKSQNIEESESRINNMKAQINVELKRINQMNINNLRDYRLEIMKIDNESIRNEIYKAYQEVEEEYKGKQLEWDKDKFTAEIGGKMFGKMVGLKSSKGTFKPRR